MKLTLDVDVYSEFVEAALNEFRLALLEERPLSNLERLGEITLGNNIEAIALHRREQAADRRKPQP